MSERLCPLCGAALEQHAGAIEETVISPYGRLKRRARPAVFFACPRCEHCEEK